MDSGYPQAERDTETLKPLKLSDVMRREPGHIGVEKNAVFMGHPAQPAVHTEPSTSPRPEKPSKRPAATPCTGGLQAGRTPGAESGLWWEANWLGSQLQTGARDGAAYRLILDLWISRQAAFRYE
ncbi:hypothetical protein GCM10007382_13570 [Salinibacterium xinjiangense]|nr:hypothetical protein GCM10007382_13570 [Salinibacterium xinjiangense]